MTDRELFEKWTNECGRVQGWRAEKLRVHVEAQRICYNEIIRPLVEEVEKCVRIKITPGLALPDGRAIQMTLRKALAAHRERLK